MEAVIRPTAMVFDDTGFLKDGDASACVSRQYTGTAGKVTNCQVGVSLHLTSQHASAAINWRLFLPQTWAARSPKADPDKVARRTACGIPDDIGHVEKWQLALDMADETRSWGIDVPLAIADAGYGDAATFRLGLAARGLNHMVGISSTLSAQPGEAVPVTGDCSGRGRPPVAEYPDKPRSVKQLVIAVSRKAAKPVQWREGSRPGTGRSDLKRMYSRFVPCGSGLPDVKSPAPPTAPCCPSAGCWPSGPPPTTSRSSSGSPICTPTTPLTTLVRLATLRWRIEHDYRELKQALGLAHFEGRTWNGWHHHVTLVSVAHAFCTLQRLAKDPKGTALA